MVYVGKSEVIKVFSHFAKSVSTLFGWVYDGNVINITAYIGAVACEVPNGKTLHSDACIYTHETEQDHKDKWKWRNMLIVPF